jgi:anti-anti-sigma factor
VATPTNFRIETLESRSGITIKLAGELDGATCAELLARFEQALAKPGVRHVVLDLEAVSFIDSAGMRAMIMIERGAIEREVTLSISPPPHEVTDLLQITGLSDHVTLSPQGDDAPPNAPFSERIDLELARDSTAPGRARAELRDALRERLSDPDRATVTLLTSELVTNAVIHPAPTASGPVGLRITCYPDRVRVEVTDAGAGFDIATLPPRPREAGGHGLIVVDGLSSRWGTSHDVSAGSFCVWFELDAHLEPSAAAPGEASAETAAARDQRSVATADG